MKKLIFTTFLPRPDYPEYDDFLWEWLVSLRTLGEYKEEIVVFDYSGGSLEEMYVKNKNISPVRFIPLDPVPMHQVSNRRNVDVIPFLSEYTDYLIAHFDADIWFQGDINPMFNEINETEGAYLAVEPRRGCNFRNGPPELEELHIDNQKKMEGFIWGGFFAGKQKPFIERLKAIKKLYDEETWDITYHGTDQSLFQTLVDFSKDRLDGLRWGASHYLCNFKEGKWYLSSGTKEAVRGLHLVAFGRARKDSVETLGSHYRFKHLHKEIYESWKNPQ